MTDDVNAKVTIDATQAVRALASLDKNVSALRKELQDLGIDLSKVNRNLDAIESASSKAAKGIQQTTAATNQQASASDRLNAATAKRVQAERELRQQRNRFDSKSWDAEFNALSRATSGAENFNRAQQSIISQRYALYDVANYYKIIGLAAAGAGTYVAVVGAQFQTAFSNVQRTMDADSTPAQINAIRDSLVNLSGQIPLTFQDLSSIATIGNQMGLAGDQVIGFTETIARFSSVAGISIDETSKAFGGFMAQTGLGAQYLENLGSAIAYVSLESNATEAEILSLTREIAAQASGAGFAADQIVGLAGSLARLRIPPERARGSLTTYFETLNKAVAEGGDKLENFAIITGRTAEELSNMVASGQGAQVLRDFLQGLGDTGNTVAATQALNALGLQQLRISDTFRRLSNDLNAYDKDQQNANTAFMNGAELSRQYGITVETLGAQWQIFVNGLNAVIDAISGGAIPTLTGLFQAINQVVFALANWIGDNQDAARMIAFGVAVATVTGFILVLRGMLVAGRAAMLALAAATQQAGAAGAVGAAGMSSFAASTAGAAGSARAATGAVIGLGTAIRRVLSSTGIGLLITLGGSLLGDLAGGFISTDNSAKNASLSMAQYNKAMADANAKMKSGTDASRNLADQLGGGGDGGGGGVSGAAQDAAQKVRTLTDYVSDLNGVIRRSSEIRFGSQAAMDEITLKWINLNEKITEYQSKIRSLTADRSLREYWLQNALAYDDQIRAGQLREEIAKIDDDLAAANKGASTELKGNSKAAIENRKTMRDLAGSYDDYISALAAAGVSQSDIQAIIKDLNIDFVSQGTQLGYASNDLSTYTQRFVDLSKIVAQVPRDITIDFNPDPAQQALNEFFAKAAEQAKQAGYDAGGGGGGGGFGGGFGDGLADSMQIPDYSALLGGDQVPDEAGYDSGKGWGEKWYEGAEWVFRTLGAGSVWDTLFAEQSPIGNAMGTAFSNEWVRIASSIMTGPATGPFGIVAQGIWQSQAQAAGEKAGRSLGGGLIATSSAVADAGNVLGNWANFVVGSGQAWNAGAAAGDSVGQGLRWSINSSLQSITLSVSSVMNTLRTTFPKGGFAEGGYTGAGHWLQPAGVVHRGEYVIPKKHVDQRTGLPDMRYMASLQNAKSAPARGYSNGGYVNSGFNGPIELGPHSLQTISNSMSVKIGIGARALSDGSSRGDRENARYGSN